MDKLYKSALELSDSVGCNERQSAIMMVRRCMADLKPGVFDAPLRDCGLPTNSQEESSRAVTPLGQGRFRCGLSFRIGLRCRCGGCGLPTQLSLAPCSRPSRPLRVAIAIAATQPVLTATARDTLLLRQVGMEKQLPRPNRETKLFVHRTGRGDPLSVVGVDQEAYRRQGHAVLFACRARDWLLSGLARSDSLGNL